MISFGLAIKSFWRAPKLNMIAMLAIAATLMPIMVLWSMKVGFIESLLNDIRSSPSNLEVRIKGDYVLHPEQFREIAELRGVGFVLPTARYLATRAFATRPGGGNRTPVSLMPTASGDPLVKSIAGLSSAGGTAISKQLQTSLGVAVGDMIEIANSRRDGSEILRIPLRVESVEDGDSLHGNWVFVSAQIVQDIEAFVDGYALPQRGVVGRPLAERPEIYSGLRLYAAAMDDVAALANALEGMGFAVESNAARIEAIHRLDVTLSWLFLAIAAILLFALFLSAWSWLAIQLDRLRHHVALLVLMGLNRVGVSLYFVFIGIMNAIGGTVMACGASYAFLVVGNHLFHVLNDEKNSVFVLPFLHAASISVFVLLIQFLIAVLIAYKANRIEPKELFREQ